MYTSPSSDYCLAVLLQYNSDLVKALNKVNSFQVMTKQYSLVHFQVKKKWLHNHGIASGNIDFNIWSATGSTWLSTEEVHYPVLELLKQGSRKFHLLGINNIIVLMKYTCRIETNKAENKEVACELEHCDRKKRVRGEYDHYTAETRAKISKYACKSGNKAAIKKHSMELGHAVSEGTVKNFKRKYLEQLKSVGDPDRINSLPTFYWDQTGVKLMSASSWTLPPVVGVEVRKR